MIFSSSCVYGIRAVVYLAMQYNRQFVPIREISMNLNISFHFLTKILQILTENGLVISFRGPKGGVKLTRSPDSISLIQIIHTLDGSHIFDGCILGLPGCTTRTPCLLHDHWAKQREQLKHHFSSITLKTLAEQVQKEGLRLYDFSETANMS